MARHSYGTGVFIYNRSELESLKAKGKKVRLTVVALLHLADDISPEMANEAIEFIQVRGVFQASQAVKAVLADRMN